MIQVINIKNNGDINVINDKIELSNIKYIDWLYTLLRPYMYEIKKYLLKVDGIEIHLERNDNNQFIHFVSNDTRVECIDFTLFEQYFQNIMLIIKERVGVNENGEIYDKLEKK